MAPSARTRRLRWFAPVATGAVVALVAAIPGLSAAGSPNLAPLTPAQLLAKVQQAKPVDLSGTINLTTNLGIPNLSALSDAAGGGGRGGGGAFSATSLLSGGHKALVWYAGPDRARVALLGDMAENDVVHNGVNTWTWDSVSKKVVHYTEAAPGAPKSGGSTTDPTEPTDPVQTPQQLADQLLAQVTPSTTVSVAAPVTVASQKTYELVLSPHAAQSTIDHVVIAVDSVTSLPLQVQIFAKGQKAAAVDLGFGQITYATPAASNFNFTPPAGSTVTNKTLGGTAAASPKSNGTEPATPDTGNQPVTVGQDWTSVVILKQVQIPAQLNDFLRGASSVHGTFGSGKVLGSSLVNVLVLDDGRVAVGAVSAAALEAAVAAAP